MSSGELLPTATAVAAAVTAAIVPDDEVVVVRQLSAIAYCDGRPRLLARFWLLLLFSSMPATPLALLAMWR